MDHVAQYLTNGLSNPDETYREYSPAPTDDWLDSEGQGQGQADRRGGRGIHINVRRRSPSSFSLQNADYLSD